jgi:hypothetical protein
VGAGLVSRAPGRAIAAGLAAPPGFFGFLCGGLAACAFLAMLDYSFGTAVLMMVRSAARTTGTRQTALYDPFGGFRFYDRDLKIMATVNRHGLRFAFTPQAVRRLGRYKRRKVVERCFARVRWQGRLPSRCECDAANFLGFVHLASAFISNHSEIRLPTPSPQLQSAL